VILFKQTEVGALPNGPCAPASVISGSLLNLLLGPKLIYKI